MKDFSSQVLFEGLKTPNPRREVKSVVIHIYSSAFHELFLLKHIHFSAFALHLEKKIKISSLHYKNLKPHVNTFYGV